MALTRLKPAPLTYPNGGGLASMATKPRQSQKLEVEAMQKKHEAELAKLKEKHSKENSSSVKVKK